MWCGVQLQSVGSTFSKVFGWVSESVLLSLSQHSCAVIAVIPISQMQNWDSNLPKNAREGGGNSIWILCQTQKSLIYGSVGHPAYYSVSFREVYQLWPFLKKPDLAIVTHAVVTSRLDYCNALCVGMLLETIWKLCLVQNYNSRFVSWGRLEAPLYSNVERV